MSMRNILLALGVVFVGAIAARAAETATAEAATQVAASPEKSECSACPISAAMKQLPQLSYVVGEECTHCSKSAAKLAKQEGVSIRFAVGKETFDDEGEAKLALVAATEEFVEGFGEPCKCEVSGITSIAGQKTQCTHTAGKLAELVRGAMKQVAFAYEVGDEQCACPNHAASLAKSSGKTMLFVVGGEKTTCETTARLALARAKFRAAMEAIVEAEAVEKPADSQS